MINKNVKKHVGWMAALIGAIVLFVSADNRSRVSYDFSNTSERRWEKFDQQLYRYSIYGGWLVKYGSMGMTFVPDSAHQWKLDGEDGR
tara:strand:+ start:724 stop:987 length:264 start_codon:yes stop_codon:yes gene_type:complete